MIDFYWLIEVFLNFSFYLLSETSLNWSLSSSLSTMSLPIFNSKKISHPLEDEGFEEELRVAEEMSFLDEYDLFFDPTHLEDTKDRVKMYEDIVDEQLLILDTKGDDDNAPLRDSQIRDLFGFSSSLDSDKMLAGGTAPPQPRGDDGNNRITGPKPPDYSPTFLERRSMSKEQKLKETVDSICRSLRWYQNKIVKQIESTSEVCLYLLAFFVV